MAAQSAVASDPTASASKAIEYKLEGAVEGGGTVTLFVHSKKNSSGKIVPKYVGAMFFSDFTPTCDEGSPSPRSISTQSDIRINSDGVFSYKFSTFKAKFSGKVTKGGKKATGTVSYGPGNEIYDDDTGTYFTNCGITPPRSFSAKNVG